MHRFLADENIPRECVRRLRSAGFDVEFAVDLNAGAPDTDVLIRAGVTRRILITEDRDFGALVYARAQASPPGVLYLRLGNDRPAAVADALLRVVLSERILIGQFTILSTNGQIRQRPLPPPPMAG